MLRAPELASGGALRDSQGPRLPRVPAGSAPALRMCTARSSGPGTGSADPSGVCRGRREWTEQVTTNRAHSL